MCSNSIGTTMVAPFSSLSSSTITLRASPFFPLYVEKIIIGSVSARGICFMMSGVISSCLSTKTFFKSDAEISTGRTSAPTSLITSGVLMTWIVSVEIFPAMKRSTLSAKDFSSASNCCSAALFSLWTKENLNVSPAKLATGYP